MKVLITQDVNGVETTTDYTHYVVDGSITVEDSVNVPTLTSFQLVNVDDAFVVPKRSSYVQILSEIYAAGGGYIGPSTQRGITIPGTTGVYKYTSGGINTNFPYDYNTGATVPIVIPCTPGQVVSLTYVSGLCAAAPLDQYVTPIGQSSGNGAQPGRQAGYWVPGSDGAINPSYPAPMACLGVFADSGGNIVGYPFLVGLGGNFTCPPGAVQLQLGANDGYLFADNQGSWLFNYSVGTSGIVNLTLATGFVTNEPERVYLGLSNKVGNYNNQVYTYNINVSSDEWLLNCQAIPYIPAFVNQTDSQILAGIAEALMPGFFSTALMASGNLIPYYQYDPTQTWSDVAKTFADQNRYHYKVINKSILYQPFGDEPLGIAYDDQRQKEGFLAPLALTTGLLTVPPVNDCTVIGDVEPQTNWNNYLVGDGFTSNFQLRHQVFEGTSSNLLQDDWTESSFTQGTWTVNDPAGVFVLADGNGNALGALNVVQKGQTGVYQPQVDAEYILAQNGLELGGGLNLQHGSVTFNDTASGGGGIIGGIYGTSTFTPGTCLAGFGISGQPNIGTFTVVSVQIIAANSELVTLTINGTAPTNIYPGNVFSCASFGAASFLNGTDQTVTAISQISPTQYTITAQGAFTYNNPYGPTADSGSITFASNAVFVTASGAAGIVIQPIYNGQYVGQPVVTQVNHQYLLQTWIGAGAQTRYTRPYTNLTQTATYGAQDLAASGTITWVITDVFLGNYVIEEQNPLFGLFPSAPPPVVTQYSTFNTSLPPFALYCLVNAVDLNVSINYTDLSLPPQGYLTVQSLTGMSGGNLPWKPSQLSQPIVYQLGFGQDNQTAQISAQGEAYSLSFYTDDIPSVGARIVFQSWAAGQSVARVQDTVAIANEAQISGDSGIRSAIMTNLSPLPRTSDECEAAAAAAILDNEYPQFQGTYTIQTIPYKFENLLAPSIYGYPMTGRFLYVNSPIRAITGQNFYVNTCRFNVLELKQEVLSVSVDYGMDLYLEKLLPAFLESPVTSTILAPTQTVPPPNPITLPQVLNATLPTLDNASVTAIVNSLTGNYIVVSLGTVPVTGCEVRSVDSGWGVADQGRVGLFTSSTFTLPRTSRDQTWYLRTLNGSIYSRFSKALRVVYPLIPSPPTLVNANAQAIVFDYAGDVRDIYGLELRATPVSGVEFVEFPDVPEDQFAQLTRANLQVPTDASAAGRPVKNSGNVVGIYNPPMNSVPFPFPEQLELGDVIYVVCPVDQSFAGVQLVTNILTATGNSGVQLPQTLSFTNAVGFFMPNPSRFNGAFAYGYPLASSVASYGYSIQATVALNSLEFNFGQGVGGQSDPNIQPILANNYDTHGNFLGVTTPWSGATQGWAMAITGNLVFPAAGAYTFELIHDDGAYWGVGGGATVISGPGIINSNTTMSVTNIPTMGGNNQNTQHNSGGDVWKDVFVISIPGAGAYPFEINYAQWYNEQTLALGCNNASIFPGSVVPASSGAPWGIGWFDYGEPFPDQQGSAVFGTNADIATVQLYNRGASTVCASGAISGNYTGISTVWTTPNPHNLSPGQQFIMGAGWRTFPQTGYPALPNTGSVFCGLWNVSAVLDAYTFQFTNTTLANPNLTPGTSAQVIAQQGVPPQYLNGLIAPMPTPFNLPASSGIIIQRPVFAPSDLVIDLTQPDIAETFGILQALSPGGRVQGLTAYFFNLTWDYSYGTAIPSFQVPALTGVFINEQTQQVSWNLSAGSPDGYRIDITDPTTGQLYNQFTIDHPYNPLLLTQFQMSNIDFSQARNITITPFDIAGDGVPVTVYHPAGTITLGNGTSTVGDVITFGCTWQGQLSPASGIIMHIPIGLGIGSVTMPIGLSGSAGHLLIAPATNITLPIFINGVQFGTMTFLAGSHYAIFSGSVQVLLSADAALGNNPDYLTVALPNTVDSLASDLGFMLVGYVGLP